MRRTALLIASCLVPVACAPSLAQQDDALAGGSPAAAAFAYPETRAVEQTDEYFGAVVADPYRWLENDVREDEEVAAWVEAQNEVTFGYLETLPQRERIRGRLEELWNYERYSLPFEEGGRYFYRFNDGLQDQSVLLAQTDLAAEPELIIDPNAWSDDGATALAAVSPSPDGRYLAYSVQDGGTDWRIIRVLDLATGEELEDEIRWVKFSGVNWAADSSGFYYQRFPEPEEGAEFQSLNFNAEVRFHAVGEAQGEDRLVYSRPEAPEEGFAGFETDDGAYTVIYVSRGTDDRYEIAVIDRNSDDQTPRLIVEGFENDYGFIGNDGSTFYFTTNRDAPLSRVIAMDVDNPEPENWVELIPETENSLTDASYVGGHLIVEYLVDARAAVFVHAMDGSLIREVALPGVGSAGGFEGEADDPETFYSFSSFNQPPTIYRYDVTTGESTVFRQSEVDFDPEDYVVEQRFYESADGTRVPMFIAYRRGSTQLDGTTPTLLYGYGGFNISLNPSFSVANLAWMEMGGVYALANIRGGGEYGAEWHDGGRLFNKQNVFDDFIAAGEYLVAEGFTSPEHLAIRGGSNGGLLVGAVANQRPDLFAAALPAVGVMDMLRFTQFTAGRYWTDDYGDPNGSVEEFENLFAYSPYHNIEDGVDYPATLVTTADTDDRVVPGHSFKYIARLQAAHAGADPVLIRVETRAGHGAGTPTSKAIEQFADLWAFIAEHTGLVLEDDYGASE